MAGRIDSIDSSVRNNSASLASSITETKSTITTTSSSIASDIQVLSSSYQNASSSLAANIISLSGTIVTNSSSAAIIMDRLDSSIKNSSSSLASSITDVSNTSTNASSSLATRVSTLSSSVGSASSSLAASITTTAVTLATVSGSVANISGEYGVVVNAGKITGFKALSSPTTSEFIVQADKFQIVNSSGGSGKAPFIVEGGVTYIDGAVIKNLDAGKITAGTIDAALTIKSPKITGGGITIDSSIGMRYKNDSGVFTITGGSDNATGGQIDLVGNSFPDARAGIVQIIAGNVSTGQILLKTGGDNTRLKVDYNGSVGINTSDPDGGYKLDVNGGTKIGGIIATSGDIRKITSDDWTVEMYDGNNTISQQWDGSDYKVKVDATDFIIAREGSDVSFNSVNTTSSERYKKNITNLIGSLDIIDNLQPKIYDRKDGSRIDEIGLIAEEVYKVLPNIVCKNEDDSIEGLDYSKLVPVLLGAIKELKARIEQLENK